MYGSQAPWVELYDALLEFHGADAYADLLEPWPDQNPDERSWLVGFTRGGATDDEALCRLYAASRVTTLLLLRFQTGRADRSDYPGPPVTVEGFQLFHEAIGFRVPEPVAFHPFFHEIVGVLQITRPETRVEMLEQVWPPLMLGDMMYCRAGVVVSAGTVHVVKEIAEQSKLYWAFRRKNRPYVDQSHGWGSNSQWRTQLRRDYLSPAGYRYNVDGDESLNTMSGEVDGMDVSAMVELVRNRCFVRTVTDDSDLYPYRYTYTEAITSGPPEAVPNPAGD